MRKTLQFTVCAASAVLFLSAVSITVASAVDLTQQLQLNDVVTHGRLENGITYYIQHNQLPRDVIDLRLVVQAGSAHEEEHERGLAHLIEHMGFNGTELYPGNQIISELELIGAEFGPDLNAYTSFDQTVYTLQLTDKDPQVLEKGLRILQQWGFAMELDRTELRKERGVVIEEERIRRSARQRIADQHFNTLLLGTNYHDRLPIGRAEVIRGASVEDIRAFYRRWYRPERMAVIAIGDLEPQSTLEMIRSIFEGEQQSDGVAASRASVSANIRDTGDDASTVALREYQQHEEPHVSIIYDPEATEEHFTLYLKRPAVEQNTVASYLESIELILLSFILQERFLALSEEPQSPIDYAVLSSDFWQLNHALEIQTLVVQFADGQGEDAIELVLKEIGKVAQGDIQQHEYQRAVSQLKRLYEQYQIEASKREVSFYSNAYTRHFLYGELLLDVDEEVELAYELIDMVDPMRFAQYAQNLLSAANRTISYTGIEKIDSVDESDSQNAEIDITAEALLDLITAAQSAEVSDTGAHNAVRSQVVDSVIDSEQLLPQQHTTYSYDQSLEVHRWEYANGITVLFRHNDYSEDTVHFNLYRRGGSSLYDDSEYLDAAHAVDITAAGGVAELAPSELRYYLADKQVSVSPYFRHFTEGMEGSFSIADRSVFGELLYAYFTSPRFDATQVDNWRRRTIEQIADRDNNPLTQLWLRQQALLTNDNLRMVPPTVPQVESIDVQNAYQIYRERFAERNASGFVLVFVGNMSAEQLQKDVLERYVASVPSDADSEVDEDSWRLYSVDYLQHAVSEEIYAGVSERSVTSMLYFGDYQWGLTDNYIFSALADYLNQLLHKQIREESSAVYNINADVSVQRLPSSRFALQIFFGSDPEQTLNVIAQIKEVVEMVRRTPPSNEELERIKETNRSQFLRNSQTNRYWINLLRLSDIYELDMNEAHDYARRVDALTAEDIQRLAMKYLSQDRLITLILKPESLRP